MKYLIVNADDFGMCRAANDAVIALFDAGRLFSSTVMLPCPESGTAARFAAAHPEYAVGVHLTLTSEWQTYRWAPLTAGPSLRDEEGFMWRRTEDVEKRAVWTDIEAEIEAQYRKALSYGMHPSHVDNHMGTLYGNRTGRFSLLVHTMKWLGQKGLPYRLYTKTSKAMTPRGTPWPAYKLSGVFTSLLSRRYGVVLPDYLLFPDWTAELSSGGYAHYREEILRQWTSIPDGVTETFLHPALETDELKAITPNWFQRVWEYALMNDPGTHTYLAENGIQMISYRELVKIKKG